MIGVLGAGAFGTALAVALGRDGKEVVLYARTPAQADALRDAGENRARLPGVALPGAVRVAAHADLARRGPEVLLLAVPTQAAGAVLAGLAAPLSGHSIVACCKGIDIATGAGPTALITAAVPGARAAVLSGPSFAADIARGLPTALTLAGAEADRLQRALSTPSLRLYSSDDVAGVEMGGALKNVIAIACGTTMGAGLGESARAALMTRGFAEMMRVAEARGARRETLMGLSGFGDLALTCSSPQSRNFRYGQALGQGAAFDPGVTVEGRSTAQALAQMGLELPICQAVAEISAGRRSVAEAIQALLSRPLRAE